MKSTDTDVFETSTPGKTIHGDFAAGCELVEWSAAIPTPCATDLCKACHYYHEPCISGYMLSIHAANHIELMGTWRKHITL